MNEIPLRWIDTEVGIGHLFYNPRNLPTYTKNNVGFETAGVDGVILQIIQNHLARNFNKIRQIMSVSKLRKVEYER